MKISSNNNINISIDIKFHKNDLPDNLDLGSVVAIDTEAMGLVTKRDRLCLVQVCDDRGNVHMVHFPSNSEYDCPNLVSLLNDQDIEKIFHFARFDVAILDYYLGADTLNIYCTKIASKIARTFSSHHGLKYLCRELLGIELSKHEQTSYWGASELSDEQLRYAAGDVIYLHSLKDKLNKLLYAEGRYELARACMDAIPLVTALDIMDFNFDEIMNH